MKPEPKFYYIYGKHAVEAAISNKKRKIFEILSTDQNAEYFQKLSKDATTVNTVANEILANIRTFEVGTPRMIKAWRALPSYDGRAQLSTWLYAITRNTAISALRRRR